MECKCQRSNIKAVEMNYLRGGCGVKRMEAKSNEKCIQDNSDLA